MSITWTNTTVKLNQLMPWEGNPKTSTAKNAKQLQDSKEELGQFQTVAIGPSNGNGLCPVYDGHQRLSSWLIKYGPNSEIDARQSSQPLTDEERRKVAIYSRQIGAWDWEVLSGWEPAELIEWGFDVDTLGDWRRDVAALGDFLESQEEPPISGGLNKLANCVYSQEQIIDAAFIWFRANGFPYRNLAIHVSMQEINKLMQTEPENLINTNTGYHVADTYHPHRFHAAAEGMRSMYDAYTSDELLRKALKLEIEYGTIGVGAINNLKFVNGTQPLSNFRPGFAAYLYRKYCPDNATVLDTSTGYGGRLVGFIASGKAGFYIGIDPSTETHAGNMRMAEELQFSHMIELHNLPAEDVPHEVVNGRCDFAFTSPPYFRKEHYSDEDTQSWKRYETGDDWRRGFLEPMMRLQFAALRASCYSIVNIADVTIKNKPYPLKQWAIEAGIASGFDFIEEYDFPLTRRFGAGMDDEISVEPVLVFMRPEPIT